MTRWPGGRGGVGQYINNNPLLLRYMIMGSLLGSEGRHGNGRGSEAGPAQISPLKMGMSLCYVAVLGEERSWGWGWGLVDTATIQMERRHGWLAS